MAKKTLLELVQNILSAMDSDEVNSIGDTVESNQVAEIVRETYEDLVSTLSIPERRALSHLEGVADTNRPNYLRIPDNVKEVLWIKYADNDLDFLDTETFMKYVLSYGGSATVTDTNGVSYSIPDNESPKYWTSFDDEYVVFNAYNVDTESTLQSSNSLAFVEFNNDFQLTDSYVPDIDENLFPLLLSESKKASFVNLKQVSNSNEEARSRRQLVRVQNDLSRSKQGKPIDRLPNYGRNR
jgi:hypothetical protein